MTVALLCSVLFFVIVCAGAEVTKPSKGTWSGNSYVVGNCPEPSGSLLTIDIGKGFSTQLGASDWFAVYCLDPVEGNGYGNAVITAANGDALFLQFFIQSSWTSSEGGIWTLEAVYTSGTGRFTDVTGGGTTNGTFLSTGPTSFSWVGTHEGEATY